MYHVATELPFNKDDPQQLDKKRHLGNDIVMIIYLDCTQMTPIDTTTQTPTINTSSTSTTMTTSQFEQYIAETVVTQFNHILIVVAPAEYDENGKPTYYVQCAFKEGIQPFIPVVPSPMCRIKSEKLRQFMMCKLINGELSAYSAPSFKDKFQKTRQAILTSLYNDRIM
eukprot:TRINITY_DN5450_c0_g1_i1.p1 TRINITY_DN5450_c0_g1~~TRINITY_DN5450_c0_g1_i1.p1  ORF type:complete len:189 (+),score=33.13 TRINITY_DN5450_c0_g1_i1:62-568(+)